MKRNNLSFCNGALHSLWLLLPMLLLGATTLYAQSAEDTCKLKLIENINQGNFDAAVEDISCVEDWTFDISNLELYLDVSTAIEFEEYAESKNVASELCDSLLVYLKHECDAIGLVYYNQGKYEDALPYLKISVNIVKIVYGEFDTKYMDSLNQLGSLYVKMGEYTKAEEQFVKVLQILKVIFGKPHPAPFSWTSLHNLGVLYIHTGDYTKAEQYLLEASSMQKKLSSDRNPDYATTLSSLGLLYYTMGNYAKAETNYLKAYQIYKQISNKSPLDYANVLNSLGVLYSNMGDYIKAEQYYKEAQQIQNN